MAISFPQGFIMTHQEPVDNRLVLTKEQMSDMLDAKMPETYFAVCADDGAIYVYQITNEPTEETGRFRKLDAELANQLNMLNTQVNGDEETSIVNRLTALEEKQATDDCCVWTDLF